MTTLTCYAPEDTVPEFPAFPAPAISTPDSRRVIALIPVHNERGQLTLNLDAVFSQTRPPDEVYVLTDNALESLVEEAAWFPVSIISTVGNQHKKAGNLNRCLALLLPWLRPDDVIVGFDADSVPSADFIENALAWIGRGYGAVGATFHGRKGGGVLGLLQRAEFARFARHQHRKASCDVLSGTGWAVPVSVMREVAASRQTGHVYDIAAIVEDYELTLRIKSLGISAVSPSDCLVRTDVMETAEDWVTQRLRWQYGTLIALSHYGWNRVTQGQILRQILTYLTMLASPLVVVYLGWSFGLFGWRGIDPLNAPYYFAGIAGVVLEQAYQARRAGWLAVLSTLLIVPDFLYSLARQYVYLKAAYRALSRKGIVWGAGTSI